MERILTYSITENENGLRIEQFLRRHGYSKQNFTELKKIAAIAQAYNTMVIPHVWGSGVGLAASLQDIASLPTAPLSLTPVEPMLEYDQSSHPFRLDLIRDGIEFTDGFVKVPDTPGIGVEIDRKILDKFQIN